LIKPLKLKLLVQFFPIPRVWARMLFVILKENYCGVRAHWRFRHFWPWMYPI
jgi:hypothetical protein